MNDRENTVVPTGANRSGAIYAVVIGINEYDDASIPRLSFARADAESVYATLIDKEVGRIPTENVTLLVDKQATRRAIKSALGTKLRQRANPNDTVLVYFAGHGAPEIDLAEDNQKRGADGLQKFLVPWDAEMRDLYATAISMDEITELFNRIAARTIVIFLDACYSGNAGGRTFSRPDIGLRKTIIDDGFLTEMAGEGRMVVTSCDVNEVSIELPELGHGVFTYYLIKGLCGEAGADGGGIVYADELFTYVSTKVPEEARQHNGKMLPVRKGEARGRVVLTRDVKLDEARTRALLAGSRLSPEPQPKPSVWSWVLQKFRRRRSTTRPKRPRNALLAFVGLAAVVVIVLMFLARRQLDTNVKVIDSLLRDIANIDQTQERNDAFDQLESLVFVASQENYAIDRITKLVWRTHRLRDSCLPADSGTGDPATKREFDLIRRLQSGQQHDASLKGRAYDWVLRTFSPSVRVAAPRVVLDSTDLRRAQLYGLVLDSAYFRDACLTSASFTGAQLQMADFSFASLQGVQFNGAHLQCALFVSAPLEGAHFDNADLAWSSFNGAQLRNLSNWHRVTSFRMTRLGSAVPGNPERDEYVKIAHAKDSSVSLASAMDPTVWNSSRAGQRKADSLCARVASTGAR